jgi:Lrp/AsnC family leucine-responsive transcriptional regulator
VDAVDRRIVEILQENGRILNTELAEMVHLSPSAYLRRVRALEQAGLIAGYRAVVDRGRAGLYLTVFVEIRGASRHSRATAERVQERLTGVPAVVACHTLAGGADFLVEAAVPDLAHFERVLLDDIQGIPEVAETRSSFVIRSVIAPRGAPVSHWA